MISTADADKYDERIQVLDSHLDVPSVIKLIAESGYQDEGFYVCDLNDIIQKYDKWKLTMPRIHTYYAVKCNDSRVMIETLAALGTGFDCASEEEIKKVLSLGVHPDRIIFANPNKKISHLKYASRMGVAAMTFDNEEELYKIHKYYPSAKLVVRIKFDDVSAKYVFGKKFGCDHETEAPKLLSIARSLNLNVIGVSFHIGSQGQNHTIFSKAIYAAKELFDVAPSLGYNFTFLDIGGGFPGEKSSSIKEIGDLINSAIDECFPDPSITIISEPGRYYALSAFTLTSQIYSKRSIIDINPENSNHKETIRMYYIDVGVYNALIPVLFEEYYTFRALNSNPKEKLFPSIIWGPTCDVYDKISKTVEMLPEMKCGEWIVIEEAGAYTLSISCEFNGYSTPKIHSVIDRDGWRRLTENVPSPMSEDRFVFGSEMKHFRTGLDTPCKFRNFYFPL